MKRILFTKIGIEAEVKHHLSEVADCDFQEVIKTQIIKPQTTDLPQHAHFLLTSVSSVKGFQENGFQWQQEPVFCVGSKTAAALERLNIPVLHTAKNAEQLLQFLLENPCEETAQFVHFCGNRSLNTLKNGLTAKGYPFHPIAVYETQLLYPKITSLYDGIAFFSPSGVESFLAKNTLGNATLFALGTSTEKALKQQSQNPVITSQQQTLEDLLHTIKHHIKQPD
ncbi:uroporphyrinogen-III synthase [Riemerella columbina]|uniref:uroporphyrinogen-III synthase n=1 Tax=Riemerella columbina TaxID=103810 RepID=UPI00266FAA4D|nr:uroporphyrinogen-III synthase [Riemerella columbina]WKS95234.1 uroporphyrinogen-III synthase [Riemerella columbina]